MYGILKEKLLQAGYTESPPKKERKKKKPVVSANTKKAINQIAMPEKTANIMNMF